MYYKDEIYDELYLVNKRLAKEGLLLNLKIVGGAALIFNGISSIETNDIDTIHKIEPYIKDILEECSIDINDDAIEYIQNYEGLEFIRDTCRTFSNINIEYLDLAGVIKTKMLDTNTDKLQSLYYLLEEELEVEMTVEGICEYLKELGEDIDPTDVENFLNEFE